MYLSITDYMTGQGIASYYMDSTDPSDLVGSANGTGTGITNGQDTSFILQPTFREITYADMLQVPSYLADVWFKFDQPTLNVCHVTDVATTDPTMIEDGYDNMSDWKGAGSCGNGIAPFRLINFNFKDPNNSHWF